MRAVLAQPKTVLTVRLNIGFVYLRSIGLAEFSATIYRILWNMPNYHALAVFEATGPSPEEIEEDVSSRVGSISHQRVRYYEHEISEGGENSRATRSQIHCMVFVDCDVDAYTEEKALDFAGDVFDRISTPNYQHLAVGIIPGKPRVRRERQEARIEEGASERIVHKPQRGSRDVSRKEKPRRVGTKKAESGGFRNEPDGRVAGPPAKSSSRKDSDTPSSPTSVIEEIGVPTELEVDIEALTEQAPPARSSAAMLVTVTAKLKASELRLSNVREDASELVDRAIEEARQRHPEVPPEIIPDVQSDSLPGGGTLFSITWKYPAPVPSLEN